MSWVKFSWYWPRFDLTVYNVKCTVDDMLRDFLFVDRSMFAFINTRWLHVQAFNIKNGKKHYPLFFSKQQIVLLNSSVSFKATFFWELRQKSAKAFLIGIQPILDWRLAKSKQTSMIVWPLTSQLSGTNTLFPINAFDRQWRKCNSFYSWNLKHKDTEINIYCRISSFPASCRLVCPLVLLVLFRAYYATNNGEISPFKTKLYNLVAGLPGWPFLGQISDIWPRFKLVGLKILVGFLAFFWLHLKLVGLKKIFWPFASFLAFFRWIGFLWRKILLFYFLRQHFCKLFVINAT